MIEFPVKIQLPDGEASTITFRAEARIGELDLQRGTLVFALPPEAHLYLHTGESANFARPPRETALPLAPNTTYTLAGDPVLEGGQLGLWLIEYDEHERLCHHQQALQAGSLALRWKTHIRHQACRLAIRVSGSGRLMLGGLSLAMDTPVDESTAVGPGDAARVRVGPRGRFAAYSLFYDPSGYRLGQLDRARNQQAANPPKITAALARLRGHKRVLDLGCASGDLLAALRSADVDNAVGIAREPDCARAGRARGLHVIEHDLNEPFPFLASGSFDAAVACYSLERLAPIAWRTLLRECWRVLAPDGLLLIAADSNGPASPNDPRCSVPVSAQLLRRLLDEAGFRSASITAQDARVEAVARRPADESTWPTRRVVLASGQPIQPWSARRIVLAPSADAWDTSSARDFTLLVTPEKDEHRVDGKLVAYYTGYRRNNEHVERAVCRCVSADGIGWQRRPDVPVLTAGPPGAWDDGGVAAGSVVVLREANQTRFVMYYTGRAADGSWPGIGMAYSDDGIHWEKQPQRILPVESYQGLKFLALADVMRTTDGCWLMHCEGWVEGRGWAIFQAQSDDGRNWRPTQAEPVLDPREIPWAGCHAANPKCVEIEPGQFVLGFNGADSSGAFQLALAESRDARRWRPLDVNPVICTTTGDYRTESMFMTRDAWRRGDQQVYFFSAATSDTHLSSRVLTARADPGAAWPGREWQTTRWGLYAIRNGRLVAQPGAVTDAQALSRVIPLERETQCTLRLAPESAGLGAVCLLLEAGDERYEVRACGNGQVTRNDELLVAHTTTHAATALSLRLLRPDGSNPELVLRVWSGESPMPELHEQIGFDPQRLTVRVGVPPGEPPLLLEHLDVWQPEIRQLESTGDAHMYMGVCRTGSDLLPDIDRAAFHTVIKEHDIRRAIVTTYGASRQLDSFDQISPLTRELPGRIYPLIRVPANASARPEDVQFQIHQLEVLWQAGLLYGLKTKLNAPERPTAAVLDWAQRRQVLTMWHASSTTDLDWLEQAVLQRYSFPVLLSHFGGYPLDCTRYERAIAALDRYPNLYLITSVVFFARYLEKAIRRRPHRVLFGSDYPGVDPAVARAAIIALDVPAASKTLVLSENLRFLTERVAWQRWNQLRDRYDLLFPPLPQSASDVEAQGFEVVPVAEIPGDEPDHAKAYWGQFEISSFFREHKPWATLVANLARDLEARSVLEFGCHVGRNLAAIRDAAPDVRLVGLDINAEAVRFGRDESKLDLRVGDERTLGEFADGEFDLVFTVSVLDHIPDIAAVCRELVRVAARNVFLLEVTLPVEGKVVRHFDHKRGGVHPSTDASYSWAIDRCLAHLSRVWRLDCRPCYLHSSRLGPYYWSYLAFLERPARTPRTATT